MLALRSPSTGPCLGLVKGPDTVPQRMPLTLHLTQTHHCVPRHCLLTGGLCPLARILNDLFLGGCFSLAWGSYEVALTGFWGHWVHQGA